MSDPLRRNLRTAFDRLAAEPPPPPGELTASARRTAKRHRATPLTTSALALVVVLAGGFLGVRATTAQPGPPVGTPEPTGTAPPLAHRVITALSGGTTDAGPGRPNPWRSLVRDPLTGSMREVPYDIVTPSPDGQRALVSIPTPWLHVGVLDLHTYQVRWIPDYAGAASWSPDGTRILLTGGPSGLAHQGSIRPADNGFAIVDPTTLHTTFTPVPDLPNALDAVGVWLPDGRHIALSTGGYVPTTLKVYDLRGHLVRTLPSDGVLASEASISPSGAYYVMTDTRQDYRGRLTILDARTGRVLSAEPILREWGFVGWYDESHVVLYNASFPDTGTLWVTDFAGNKLKGVPVGLGPYGAHWFHVALGTAPTGGF